MRIRLEDLPSHLQRQVLRQLAGTPQTPTAQDSTPCKDIAKTHISKCSTRRTAAYRKRQPNNTEAEYNRLFLDGKGMYEAITLKPPSGNRYTPDWMTIENGLITLYEVKGSYRLQSHGRALTAWKEAAATFPCFKFVWVTKQKNGNWEAKRYE